MKKTFFISYKLILFLLLFVSCNSKDDSNVPLYNVEVSDFNDVLTIDGYVESVSSTNINCPGETSGEITWMAEDGIIVKEGDVICTIKDEDVLSTLDAYTVRIQEVKAELVKMQANHKLQLTLLEAQVRTNEAQTSIAKLDSFQLKYASENQRKIKELELEKTEIEKQRYQEKLKALKIIQRTDIKRLEMSLNLLNRRLISVNDRIESLTVKAPHDGMLLRSTSRMTGNKLVVGDMIWDGMALFTIPNMNTMKVMISASEISYKRIEIGNPITYTFDAIPNDTAWGKITQKTPIGKPVKRGSKVKVFDMEASVDSSLQIPTPGLSVECKIMLRSVPDTIVVPQIAVFDEDSIKVVYVKTNKGFERRQVLTGISSPKETVISQGLSPNEKVALLKPASSLVRNNTLLPDSITITDVVSRDVDIKDTHKKKKRIK